MKAMSILTSVFTYNTVRHATIKSIRVGVIYRLAQLAILCYIVVWGLVLKKGYQSTEEVSSIITTKVKGQGYISQDGEQPPKEADITDPIFFEKLNYIDPDKKYREFDTADYVVPALEYNSVFIMTNFIEIEQKQEFCKHEKSPCPSNRIWLPGENATKEKFIRNTNNFTIFIKNDIEFKRFKKKQRNIFKNMTNKYIQVCKNSKSDPLCPVWSLDNILAEAEPDLNERYQMLLKGGVIQINIDWTCDLDWTSICYPKYSFKRFDLQFKENSASSGFNFRFTNKFRINDTDYRILYKAYGIRFYIRVTGVAGKFDIIPLMLKIGAGLGLMSVTFVIADVVMLYCPCASSTEKRYYRKIKRLNANKEIKNSKLSNNDSIEEIKLDKLDISK